MYILYVNVFEKSVAAIRRNDPRELAAVRHLVGSATAERCEVAALAMQDACRGLPLRSPEHFYEQLRAH